MRENYTDPLLIAGVEIFISTARIDVLDGVIVEKGLVAVGAHDAKIGYIRDILETLGVDFSYVSITGDHDCLKALGDALGQFGDAADVLCQDALFLIGGVEQQQDDECHNDDTT